MKKMIKPSIAINESAQNLLISLLSQYGSYESLPDDIKSAISYQDYNKLVEELHSNKPIGPRFSKLYVLVDYINAFTSGSLGSEYAKSIEDNVYNQLKSAIEDEDTAVVILIDSHYNDEAYLYSREGKHLPVLHANTEEERFLYGRVGALLDEYYDDDSEVYVDSKESGIYFIYKSQFGCNKMTEGIDVNYDASRSVDEVFNVMDGSRSLDSLYSNGVGEATYNLLYQSVIDLSSLEFIPEEITIAGVATNICVLSNAILLQNEYPQAEIYVDSNTVASYDKDLHDKSLDIMKGLGINVI